MTGYKSHNFPLFFRVDEHLVSLGMTPINPARNTGDTWEEAFAASLAEPKSWEWYISKDLKHVLQADGIVLLPGWGKSKGACIELVVAVCVGHDVCRVIVDDDDALEIEDAHRGEAYGQAMHYLMDCGLGGVNLKNYVQHAAT